MTQKLECDAALSDRVLQAARAALADNTSVGFASRQPFVNCGPRNEPLLPLLVALLDATQTVAAAIADNAWDDSWPVDADVATDLARLARSVADDITNATQCPNAAHWGLPSMTAKELV